MNPRSPKRQRLNEGPAQENELQKTSRKMLADVAQEAMPIQQRLEASRDFRDKVKATLAPFGFGHVILQGSYKRHTAVLPLNDMDILVLMTREQYEDWVHKGDKSSFFTNLFMACFVANRDVKVEMQGSSVGVKGLVAEGKPLNFDFVPALQRPEGGECTYHRETGQRRTSDHERDEQRVTDIANIVAHARDVIRAVKLLNGMLEKQLELDKAPFRSFHLELLACQSMNRVQHGSLLDDFQQALKFIIANHNNCDVLPSGQERVGAYDEARMAKIRDAIETLSVFVTTGDVGLAILIALLKSHVNGLRQEMGV